MPTTYPDISLPLNIGRFRIPKAEGTDFAYQDEDGLRLFTGADAGYALGATPLSRSALSDAITGIQKIVPQTITLAYASLHLVAGMTVNLNFNFASADPNFNDFAFAVLGDRNGLATSLLYDEKYFVRDYAGLPNDAAKLFALLEGKHSGQHFTVDHTGDYTLVVGVADVGDKTGKSGLLLNDVSIGIPGSAYTVSTADLGLTLRDGTVLNLFGYEIPPGGTLAQAAASPPLLAPGGQSEVAAFYAIALNQQIAQGLTNTIASTGGGLLATDVGGTVNPLAGGLPTLTTQTSVPGSGLVATNGTALISQDGGGLIGQDGGGLISQDGGGLISQDGGGLISQDGGGLISQDGGGLISQDGGGLISQDGGGLAATGATANFVPNGAGIRAFAATSDSGAGVRSYTLTGLPDTAPATPPVPDGEVLVSPAASGIAQQVTPAVAALSNGKYVAVWSDNDTGSEFRIRGQVYNADGSTSGGIIAVSTPDNFGQTNPSVTGLADGRFVVAWTDRHVESRVDNGGTTIATDVKARFFNADGTASGGAVTVNGVTGAKQDQPVAASLYNGGAVIVFRSDVSSGQSVVTGASALLAQRYAADGTRLGSNVAVGTGNTDASQPAVAGLQDGGFVVAYADAPSPSFDPGDIYVQRFAADGSSAGSMVLVNSSTDGTQDLPAVATLTDGTFVVTWLDEASAGGGPYATVRAQRFSAAGQPAGREVLVATTARASSSAPAITALHDGGYAIAWQDYGSSDGSHLRAQAYAVDGTAQGASFAADPHAAGFQVSSPAATTLADGRLLLLGSRSDGSASDIRAEPFSFATTPSAATAYGRVVDGFVSGAQVFADANRNGRYDAGEAVATTDAYGRFTFGSVTPAGPIVATGGTDTGTGLPFGLTLTAPAGSLAVTALSTLVQKLMAADATLSLGDAMARVSVAFGLPLKTDATTLDPIRATLNGEGGAAQALVANAVVLDTLSIASAAGARGDLFARLASQIAAAGYGTVDPTSLDTLQALGLGFFPALDVSTLVQANAALLADRLAHDTDARTLAYDVTGVNKIVQGGEAAEIRAAGQVTGPVVTRYTGDNLKAQVDAVSAASAGHPFNFNFTDIVDSAIGNDQGQAYTGPVSYLQTQFFWQSQDAVAVYAATPSAFLRGGPGQDALQASGGSNVLDGRGGSNFLVGATGADGGNDTFFVDGTEGGTTWSTLVNFHAGDNATIFGFHKGLSTIDVLASAGADGYQGVTLRSELNGAGTGINASFTFSGITQATADAHFVMTADTINPGTANPIDYLLIQYV